MQVACPRCGRVVTEDDRFCGGCGTELTGACRECGQVLRPGDSFCTHCGAARAEAASGAPQTEDRRRVSVLFIDQVDSTPYAEQADPELVRRLQTRFYHTARQVISEHGGVVEKYIGDAVMALFGAPVATETDPLRCVRAGLELHRALGAIAPELERPALRYRVGVATGEALVDVAAARDGGQAIVAGDVVNTAARIQSVAPAGGVLVCGTTRRLTADTIRYEKRDPQQLRGRSRPTELWLAIAPVERSTLDHEPDLIPLVEREHELGLLAGALHRTARDRTAALVIVFGQAGIGKSRLVRELQLRASQLTGQTVTWRVGHCPPFGQNVTYAGLADIVKAQAGILDSDPPALTRQRLRQAVAQVAQGAEVDRLTEALGPLVGLPSAGLPAEEAESAWRRFLVRLAARGPTVLVFEDLHWADEPMRRFIELLAAAARNVPLLVLGTSRPELLERNTTGAGAITGSLTIALPPLRHGGMASLCQHILGKAMFTTDLLRPLVELADGNPLYAQEYVRMLVERGAVTALEGNATGGLTGTGLPMPDSVHAVIANRVDLLDPVDRAVLQAAAVVGMQFWPGAVAAALRQPASTVERSLRRLEQREFLTEQLDSTMAGESEFRFQHVLVRDVCYQRLPRTERIARHQRTGDWLETAWQRRDTDLAEVLAHHRWAAHEIARSLGLPADPYGALARQALYRAARHAYSLHALDAAAGHLARAMAFPAAPEDGVAESERLRLELLSTEIAFQRDHTRFLTGDGADQLGTLAQRLTALAGGSDEDTTEAARAWTLLGQAARLRADRSAALAHLGRAASLFEALPDSAEKLDAYAELARLHMLSYDFPATITTATTAAAIADRLGLDDPGANARVTIATARYESGDPSAIVELQELTELCRSRQLLALRRASRNLAHVIREEGDWQRSEQLFADYQRLPSDSHAMIADHTGEQMRAYFTGDLDRIVAIGDSATTAGRWEDVHDVRVCVAALRLDASLAEATETMLELARATGFPRAVWAVLAAAALYRAVLGQRSAAATLLDELIDSWQQIPVMASGEWVYKAAVAAALSGAAQTESLRASLSAGRRTRWGQAALHTVTGALARGDAPVQAGEAHLASAEILAEIPSVTDRMLALALAGEAFGQAAPERAAAAITQVREFAVKADAPALLRIAGLDPGPI